MSSKNNKKDQIVDSYMDYVSEKNKRPKSISSFMKKMGKKEKSFYKHFSSFKALERHIFKLFFHHTMDVLKSDKDYKKYDAKNKLLSFYFTFFEMLAANRGFVKFILDKRGKDKFMAIATLSELRKEYISYYQSLKISGLDLKIEKLMSFGQKSKAEMAWKQMLFVLKFWLHDTSSNFEKTDILIEKSLTTSFDLMEFQPLEGIIDLGKFLFKERKSNWG